MVCSNRYRQVLPRIFESTRQTLVNIRLETSVVACNEWCVPRPMLVKTKDSRDLIQCAIIVVDRIAIVVEHLAQGICLLEFRSPSTNI